MGLAGPHNRQKIGLDPRNTTWGNDTSKYGFKLLAGLGWKSGNGLGRTQSGSSSNIKIALKDDKLGIGCKYPGQDDWKGLQSLERLFARINGRENPVYNVTVKGKPGEYILGRGYRAMRFVRGESWQSDFKKVNTDDKEAQEKAMRKAERMARREQRKIKREERARRKSTDEHLNKKRKLIDRDLSSPPLKKIKPQGETLNSLPVVVVLPTLGRFSHRAKFLKQKKAATMSAEALREILGTIDP
ncbi:Protein pxr1 [Neolecta irregularis DAH-3]|uniref:PinX1-related protein 1 n=1 Tax=Neolecta irregularis (strain DAH-3) TaxID=1198029 RepID=A0A1U7LNU2_NEOID|nr:Protein pxr1 [Neolecta irregularis DAH-3]|eukprot:OLL24336.1 Protein pxr1 [Neolecta irregularis DAH-3]